MKDGSQVSIICFIGDPFDPPGHERYGGGHLFLFDLGRFLIQKGYQLTFFTRRNAADKPAFQRLGPLCSIYRLEVGPPEELEPAAVGMYLEELSVAFDTKIDSLNLEFSTMHSHYWIAGEIVRRFCHKKQIRHVHSVLSLGRLNCEKGQSVKSPVAALRDHAEVKIFNAADALIVVCPSEYADLKRLYPEVNNSKICVIPYGVDPVVFYPRPEPSSDFVRRQTYRFTQGPEPSI